MNDHTDILSFLLATAACFWIHVARAESETFWKITAIALALVAFVSTLVNFALSEP